jgi:O-antigen ligase
MSKAPISFLLGFGWDSWGPMNDFASHNEYLQWFFELGLPGLFLFTFILFYIPFQIVRALSSCPENARVLLIGFLMGYFAILVVIFFLNPYKIWLYIWAVSGLCLRIAMGPAVLQDARSDAAYSER